MKNLITIVAACNVISFSNVGKLQNKDSEKTSSITQLELRTLYIEVDLQIQAAARHRFASSGASHSGKKSLVA